MTLFGGCLEVPVGYPVEDEPQQAGSKDEEKVTDGRFPHTPSVATHFHFVALAFVQVHLEAPGVDRSISTFGEKK